MSYLNTPNLVFTGDFMADTSTVNNDVRHYDNKHFERYFQDPADQKGQNGWWNPEGGSVFNFQNCEVQQVSFPDGSRQHIAGGTDIVLGKSVGGPEGRALGKMLDMDPQWQMSSQLWCVRLRIYSNKNEVLLSGDIAVSGFRDLQSRQIAGAAANGQPMGGGWTSVLTNLVWGEQAMQSPFLIALKNATHNDTLSIQLNMYGFYYNHEDGRFGMGRIIGTIGPWYTNEPLTFAPNRRLYGAMNWGGGNTFFQYSNFLVDEENARLTVDLGSSFPITDSMGTIGSLNMLKETQYTIGILTGNSYFIPQSTNCYLLPADFVAVGDVEYTSGDNSWLNTTGGLVSLHLTDKQLQLLQGQQLVMVTPSTNAPGQYVMICREAINGYNVRADNHNERLEHGETKDILVYAYQWGKPLSETGITFSTQPPVQMSFGGQQKGPRTPKAKVPYINCPFDGISLTGEPPKAATGLCSAPPPVSVLLSISALTDANGLCTLSVTGNGIEKPRGYIDGQMYYLTYLLTGGQQDGASYSMDGIYISLRSYYEVPEVPTWDDVKETLTQYGNVYPIMSKYIVNLGSETAVLSKTEILKYAFTRSINDPMYMPVTRDLSEAMRQTIVKWLDNPLPGKEQPAEAMKAEKEMVAATATTGEEPAENDEIKKVKKLTELKNGAVRATAFTPVSFDNL